MEITQKTSSHVREHYTLYIALVIGLLTAFLLGIILSEALLVRSARSLQHAAVVAKRAAIIQRLTAAQYAEAANNDVSASNAAFASANGAFSCTASPTLKAQTALFVYYDEAAKEMKMIDLNAQ